VPRLRDPEHEQWALVLEALIEKVLVGEADS